MKHVYIGPGLRKYGLSHGKVFDGELPGWMEQLCGEVPEAGRLTVGIEELPGALGRMKRKGTAEFRAYERLAGLTLRG